MPARRARISRLRVPASGSLAQTEGSAAADYEPGLGSVSRELELQPVTVIERVIGDIEDAPGRSGGSAGEVSAQVLERALKRA